jgi:hypothetical protein
MTTIGIDVSYGTRSVPLRLPYLSVHRRAPAAPATRRARTPEPTRAELRARVEQRRVTEQALAERDRAVAARGLVI